MMLDKPNISLIEIPPHMVMILACSKDKNIGPGQSCAAKDMYGGQLFKKGRHIAERNNIPFFILSAKYGFLKPDTVIEYYDTKFKTAFKGPWPPTPWHGFVVGGDLYFKHAPKRFERLVDRLPIGLMLRELTALQNANNIVQWKIETHVKDFPA